MIDLKYKKAWLVFVNIKPKKGLHFENLIEVEKNSNNTNYIGAWANIIVISNNINNSLDIVPLGLDELGFEIEFIDKIENVLSLIEYNELDEDVISEINWLINSDFVFKISDKIFPYEF